MYLDLILRWTHILSAIVLAGGLFFLRVVLVPALATQSHDVQQSLLSHWRPRWAQIVMMTSGLLLLSGLINAVRNIIAWDFAGAPYHALVAVKLVLGMVLFGLSAVLSGRSELAERFRAQGMRWLNISLILAILLVGLGGYMKSIPRIPKSSDSLPPSTTTPVGREAFQSLVAEAR